MSCATVGCNDPSCAVCSVPRRFAHVPQYTPASAREAEGLKESAPAFNGTKPGRTNRGPALIKRRRKALWP